MPLSEHEERVLAEMERRLVEDDPRFVARAQRTAKRADRTSGSVTGATRRIRRATIGIVVGVACILGLTFQLALGVVGFALLLVSVYDLVGALRIRREAAEALGGGAPDPAHSSDDDDRSNGLR